MSLIYPQQPDDMPNSVEAERALLGSIILENTVIELASKQLQPAAFYSRANQVMFRTMVALHQKGCAIDFVTLSNELRKTGELERVGGATYLASLTDGVPIGTFSAVAEYASIITEKSVLRSAAKLGDDIRKSARARGADVPSVLRSCRGALTYLEAGTRAAVIAGVLASTVTPERIGWLWRNHIPCGRVTLWDGDPGLGKSTVALDLCARVTRGVAMPDGTSLNIPAAGVVIISLEDGLADTIVPRLNAAGADLSKIRIIQTITGPDGLHRTPTIPVDLPAVELALGDVSAAVLVIDPLVGTLGAETNTYRDQDIRRAMAPVAALAERTGVAVIAIRHLNKTATPNPKYRGGGSIGIIGAARASFIFAQNPEEEGTFIMAANKLNLCAKPPALKYLLVETVHGLTVKWGGESTHTAESLVAQPETAEETNAICDARRFLEGALVDGPKNAKDVIAEARRSGISEKTLYRVKAILRVHSKKSGIEDGQVWKWALPNAASSKADESGATIPMTTLANLTTLPKTTEITPFNSTTNPANIANIVKNNNLARLGHVSGKEVEL